MMINVYIPTWMCAILMAVSLTAIVDAQDFGNLTDDMLTAHNYYRYQHNVEPLTWNEEAAANAQSWANQCIFRHQDNNKFGENIATGTSFSNWFQPADLWGQERNNYNFDSPGFSSATGHFTQMVWKGTASVGCGWKDCGQGGGGGAFGVYLVCEYYPRGNVYGYFGENVQRQIHGTPTDTAEEGTNGPQ